MAVAGLCHFTSAEEAAYLKETLGELSICSEVTTQLTLSMGF